MRGGHNRLPDEAKALRGTLRKPSPTVDASGSAEPVPLPGREVTGLERRVWRELACEVEAAGTYRASNATAFRMMVRVVALAESWAITRPAAATAVVRLAQVAAGLLAAFGLTPASRSRVPALPTRRDERREFLTGRDVRLASAENA